MEINRNNYEAYLLDQLEGKLSAESQEKLRDFLALNPECDPGMKADDLWSLAPETIQFPGKDALKKEIPESGHPLTVFHFDLYSIARLEGDLSEAQVREHEQLVEEDPTLRKEWEGWQRTRLPADLAEYPGKAQLKKPAGRGYRIPWIAVLSSAAALALVFLLLTLRSDPFAQFSQETGTPDASEELNQKNSQGILLPPTEHLQNEDPVAIEGQRAENDQQGDELREGTGRVQVQQAMAGNRSLQTDQFNKAAGQGEPNDRLAGQAGSGSEGEPPSVAEPVDKDEEILRGSSLGSRIAQAYMPAPVPEGTRDRIRPLHLPPSTVRIRSLGMTNLAEVELKEVVEEYAEEKNLSLFSIASAGIRGINRITGSELELYAARDEEGDISGFKFKSKRVNITTPLQKSE